MLGQEEGMRHHRLLWLAVIPLALALGTEITLRFWPFEGYVTQTNGGRIVPGMPRADVYRLLGGPGWQPDCRTQTPPGENPEFWYGPVYTVRVDFDDDGRVIRTQHGPN